jgi:hypothetical protein
MDQERQQVLQEQERQQMRQEVHRVQQEHENVQEQILQLDQHERELLLRLWVGQKHLEHMLQLGLPEPEHQEVLQSLSQLQNYPPFQIQVQHYLQWEQQLQQLQPGNENHACLDAV